MNTKVTEGVRITVNVNFNKKLSFIDESSYVFEYHINIQNSKIDKIKLLSREWYIFDTLNEPIYVEGLGVVGEQPILDLNQIHTYSSYCELKSEIGYMEGNYTFKNLITNKKFKVSIPRFELVFPGKMN